MHALLALALAAGINYTPASGGGGSGGGCFPYLDGGGICADFGLPGDVTISPGTIVGSPSAGLFLSGDPNGNSSINMNPSSGANGVQIDSSDGLSDSTFFTSPLASRVSGNGMFEFLGNIGGDGGLFTCWRVRGGATLVCIDELGHVTGSDGLTPTAFVTHGQVACPNGSFSTLPPDGGTALVCDNTSLPANQIAYGTGAGITSSAVLKIVPATGGEALQITETGSGANTGFWFQPAPVSTTTNYAFYAAPLGGVTGQNNVVNLYSDSTSNRGFELSTIGTAGAFTNYANAVVLDAMPNSGGTAQDICLVTQKSGGTANYATTGYRQFAGTTRIGIGGVLSDDGTDSLQVNGTAQFVASTGTCTLNSAGQWTGACATDWIYSASTQFAGVSATGSRLGSWRAAHAGTVTFLNPDVLISGAVCTAGISAFTDGGWFQAEVLDATAGSVLCLVTLPCTGAVVTDPACQPDAGTTFAAADVLEPAISGTSASCSVLPTCITVTAQGTYP